MAKTVVFGYYNIIFKGEFKKRSMMFQCKFYVDLLLKHLSYLKIKNILRLAAFLSLN